MIKLIFRNFTNLVKKNPSKIIKKKPFINLHKKKEIEIQKIPEIEITKESLLDITKMNSKTKLYYLDKTAENLKNNLKKGKVFKILNKISPLTIQALSNSNSILFLEKSQFLVFLSYSIKNRYIKILEKTKSLEYLKKIIYEDLENLQPEEISVITHLLTKSKIQQEDLYLKISNFIMKNPEKFNNRCLSNIINDFSYISRQTKGFLHFYEFMKEPIVIKLINDPYTLIDVSGYLRGFSKTYTLSETFMEVLEKSFLEEFGKKNNRDFKNLAIFTHTFFLNRNIYFSGKIRDLAKITLEENYNGMKLVEILKILNTFKNEDFKRYHFDILLRSLKNFQLQINILDLKLFFTLFFDFMKKNPNNICKLTYLKNEPKIYKVKDQYKSSVDIIVNSFNKLNEFVDSSDLIIFLKHLDFIIDHNTEESRNMVRNLRSIIKRCIKKGELFGVYEDNLKIYILNSKSEKIRKLFLNKF